MVLYELFIWSLYELGTKNTDFWSNWSTFDNSNIGNKSSKSDKPNIGDKFKKSSD